MQKKTKKKRKEEMLTFLEARKSMPLATWYEKLSRSSVSRGRASSCVGSFSRSDSLAEVPETERHTAVQNVLMND